MTKFVEIFTPAYDPISTLVCSYLGIAGLATLYQVNKAFYRLKEYLEKRHFNLNKRLSDFVADPHVFRSQLGKYNALISGPFALDFFEFGRSKVPHLDILAEAGIHAEEFTYYLQNCEGYKKTIHSDDNRTTPKLTTLASSTRPDVKLRVIWTSGPPIYTILRSSYLTAIINIITWNKAYSVFPRQTLVHHKSYPLKPMNNSFGSILRELSKQGWTTRDMIWPELADNQVPLVGGKRRVGDSSSLVIRLDTCSIQQASIPDFVIEYAQFDVVAKRPDPPSHPSSSPFFVTTALQTQVPRIEGQLLKSPALQYEYTALKPWQTYVTKRLQLWAWFELYKLEAQERPQQYANDIPEHSRVSIPDDFEMPESWDYADDQMPGWYREWEQAGPEKAPRLFDHW